VRLSTALGHSCFAAYIGAMLLRLTFRAALALLPSTAVAIPPPVYVPADPDRLALAAEIGPEKMLAAGIAKAVQ